MATKTIAWVTGSGSITLTYTGQGNGSIAVSSAENDSFDDRSQSFNIVTTNGTPEKAVSILVKQKGKTYSVGEVFNFSYTGSVQQITLPKGKYKLQCWGAQGGGVTGSYVIDGSKGGYSEGVLNLTKTTTLYVFVGGKGTDYTSSASQTSTTVVNGGWNGGGAGVRTSRYNSGDTDGRSFPRGGGGATDISTVTSSLSYSRGRTTRDSASLLARCIVAGGGAGASARYTIVTTTTTSTQNTVVLSESGTMKLYDSNAIHGWTDRFKSSLVTLEAGKTYFCEITTGGTTSGSYTNVGGIYDSNMGNRLQRSGGSSYTYKPTTNVEVCLGITGTNVTGDSITAKLYRVDTVSDTSTSTSSGKSSGAQQGGGTSGKGQYPGTQSSAGNGGAFGLGAIQSSTNYRYCAGGGGGGWYGGGTSQSDSSTSYVNYSGGGSGFVNTSENASYRPSGYTGLQLDSGTTKDGSTSFESTSGGTETGHSGNGYARITVLSQ